MTARHEARSTDSRILDREPGAATSATPAAPSASAASPRGPRLGELLLEAREHKGVDLYRAERDTKIRVKYLEALERSDFSKLPGAVYTKGFLRNYAIYLGLDPEAVLRQWKDEVGTVQLDTAVVIPPRPLEAPRGGLTFTPGVLIAAFLTAGVLLFAAYVAYQLLRFNQPPSLAITSPSAVVATIDAPQTTLAGTSERGTTVTIEAPGDQVYRVTADASGGWSQVVQLAKGRNQFTITATDPATGKVSPPSDLIITVPLPTPGPESPTLTVTSPTDGTSFQNGAIPIQGMTTATTITVSATYAGPEGAAASASPAPTTTPRPRATSKPGATAKPGATPKPGATLKAPAAKQITVDDEGHFSDSYQLAPGRWTLTITASGAFDRATTEQRTVSVAFTGVDLVVAIHGNPAWIKVWIDGQLADGYEAGQTVAAGKTLEFTAKTKIEVRTGNSGATSFTLNGSALGPLGGPGVPQTWLFQPPSPPQQTNRIN
ncbi:MAG TPA: RodZ domain-containing protein [Candidatus Limnocylindrales bacterium]|nr:RodZ domain-containing protein [Candidatus Limnocylindrales bacterium]